MISKVRIVSLFILQAYIQILPYSWNTLNIWDNGYSYCKQTRGDKFPLAYSYFMQIVAIDHNIHPDLLIESIFWRIESWLVQSSFLTIDCMVIKFNFFI